MIMASPIFMVNVIKYFDDPVTAKDQVDSDEAQELVKTYNHFVGKFLIRRGSYPIFLGDALGGMAAAWGVEDEGEWSEAVVVRYRNLRTMMELATSQEFSENLAFKHTALEKTIIYPTEKRLMPGGLEYLTFFMLLSGGLATQLISKLKTKNTLNSNLKRKYEFQSPNTSGGYSCLLYISNSMRNSPRSLMRKKRRAYSNTILMRSKKLKILMTPLKQQASEALNAYNNKCLTYQLNMHPLFRNWKVNLIEMFRSLCKGETEAK
jgi:uncharacterized protein (DUF1330 family)